MKIVLAAVSQSGYNGGSQFSTLVLDVVPDFHQKIIIPQNGIYTIPDASGLGLALDPETIKKQTIVMWKNI